MKTKEIEELLELIAKSALEEVNLETEHFKLSVKKHGTVTEKSILRVPSSVTFSPSDQGTSGEVRDTSPDRSYVEFKSPMVGTFYQAANPDTPPFIQVGDRIEKGQKLCVIEAMKLFNEIESDVSGTIIKKMVDDASPVEYDQPLFLVDVQ